MRKWSNLMIVGKPLVIALSSVSGGGKTAVVSRLNNILQNSNAIYFDDYEFAGPDDICDWVQRGADYSEWDLAPMIGDVENIISDNPMNLDYLLLDYPFAYIHNGMGKLIDFTVFIDTPLDIAMSRRILRDFKEASSERIINETENYLLQGRDAYLEMLNTIRPNCNLIIDGSFSVEAIANQIYEKVCGIAYY